MQAWITSETVIDGKRKRSKVNPGLRGVSEDARFVIEWIDPAGKRRREKIPLKGKAGKRLADRRSQDITAALTTGAYADKSKVTWADFRKEYEDRVLSRLATTSRICARLAFRHLERIVKPGRIESLTTHSMDRYVSVRSGEDGRRKRDKAAPSSIANELRYIRAACRVAVDWGYLAKAPKFKMPKILVEDPPAMTEEHANAIYAACEVARFPMDLPFDACDWWRAFLVFGLVTGWRKSEILTFLRSDLDYETGKIVVRAKNAKGGRDDIDYLPDIALEHLRTIRSLEPNVFPWPQSKSTLWREFQRIQLSAGIHLDCHEDHEHTPACHTYGFHSTRYSYGTANADLLPMPVLQKKMRHANPETTLRYIALAGKMKTAAEQVHIPAFLRQKTS